MIWFKIVLNVYFAIVLFSNVLILLGKKDTWRLPDILISSFLITGIWVWL